MLNENISTLHIALCTLRHQADTWQPNPRDFSAVSEISSSVTFFFKLLFYQNEVSEASCLVLLTWCFCLWGWVGWAWGGTDKGCAPTDLWCWRASSSFQNKCLTRSEVHRWMVPHAVFWWNKARGSLRLCFAFFITFDFAGALFLLDAGTHIPTEQTLMSASGVRTSRWSLNVWGPWDIRVSWGRN